MQTSSPSSADAPPAASHRSEPVDLQVIAASCNHGTCPTVYRSDRGTVVVQGYAVSAQAAGVDLPAGELLVEIPVDLLQEAARSVV
ncbi:hypothetical protein [Pseudosporangium ferrugineum]|uniref:hypothetical protein n=1 Tax=Pseudosporangium ferrugineum TaxID=439699 RepID=UPI001FE7962E|nr:hypothetical protein [Pseudosporangium ferrugineum]